MPNDELTEEERAERVRIAQEAIRAFVHEKSSAAHWERKAGEYRRQRDAWRKKAEEADAELESVKADRDDARRDVREYVGGDNAVS